MKRALAAATALLVLLLLFGFVSAELVVEPEHGIIPHNGSVTFRVENEETARIRVFIYKLGLKPAVYDSGTVHAAEHTVSFDGLEPGTYVHQVVKSRHPNWTLFPKVYDSGLLYHETDVEFKLEAGTVEVGKHWTTVPLEKTFTKPIVIIKSVEGCNNPNEAKDLCDFVVARVKNVTSSSFEVRLQTMRKNDTLSENKTVPYIVVEKGRFAVGNFQIQAGTLQTSHPVEYLLPMGRPIAVEFFKPEFTTEPVLITGITSFNGSDVVTTRNKRRDLALQIPLPFTDLSLNVFVRIPASDLRKGFLTRIDEPFFHLIEYHANEEVSYLAITPGTGEIDGHRVTVGKGIVISHEASTVLFSGFDQPPVVIGDMQRKKGDDWAVVRHANVTSSSAKFLVAEPEGGKHVNEPLGYVIIAPGKVGELEAFFTADPTRGPPPLEVSFDASASIGAISYEWDFGDGKTGTGETTTHTYTDIGTYTAKLTVSDGAGNTATAEQQITVAEEGLVANIEADRLGCAGVPCTVNFDASQSTGSITSYEWDFGDSSTGSGVQVEHTFDSLGSFTVTLTVYDASDNTDSTSIVIGVGCASNDDCLCGDGCFNGICLHPLLSINKSEDQIVGFKGEAKDVVTVWTLTNVGDHKAVVQDFWTPGCNGYDCVIELVEHGGGTITPNTGNIPVIPCEGGTTGGGSLSASAFEGEVIFLQEPPEPEPPITPEGYMVINPGESVKVVERVRGLMPPSAKKELSLGLAVQYTDEVGAGLKVSESAQKARIVLANLDLDKFHVKLDFLEQTSCVGWNDVYGVTGEYVAPRVLFDWSFDAEYSGVISINQCDKKAGSELLYCDATQFAISLLKKLRRVDELAGAGEPGVDALTEFESFLIADNFSEDFRLDFDHYYQSGFLAAPSWYNDAAKPWSAYMVDVERLKFEPPEITESGLYRVTVGFAFDAAEYEFFANGNPTATITIGFEKMHDVGVEVIDSPFYHLPFDGMVGTLREDSDGEIERKDYGLGFLNSDGPLSIAYINTNLISTVSGTGKAIYSTEKETGFSQLNIAERGKVMTINTTDEKIVFAPSHAMPVIMGIESVSGQAQAFYLPFIGGSLVSAAAPLTYWTGIAASSLLECGDFSANAMPYNAPDSRADSFDASCSIQEGRDHAFGFLWDTVVRDAERLFLKTIFYSAFNDAMKIANACTDPDDSVSILSSPYELSKGPNQYVVLQSQGQGIETFKDVVDKISSSEVCVAASGSEYTFFWNPEKIEEGLVKAKTRIGGEWQFNWANYECSPE